MEGVTLGFENAVLEVPAITPQGFLLAMISLFGLAAIAIRKVHKR